MFTLLEKFRFFWLKFTPFFCQHPWCAVVFVVLLFSMCFNWTAGFPAGPVRCHWVTQPGCLVSSRPPSDHRRSARPDQQQQTHRASRTPRTLEASGRMLLLAAAQRSFFRGVQLQAAAAARL